MTALLMRTAIIAAAVGLAACAPNLAGAETMSAAGIAKLSVGQEVSFPANNPYNADGYGCYDLDNTKELERLRTDTSALDIRARDQYDTALVTRYVDSHNIGESSHSPNFWSNACARIRPGEWYKIIQTFDWPGGGPRLHCLQPEIQLNVSNKKPTEAEQQEHQNWCLWANLGRKPGVAR